MLIRRYVRMYMGHIASNTDRCMRNNLNGKSHDLGNSNSPYPVRLF